MTLDYPRYKKILVLVILLLGVVYAAPNLVTAWQNKNAKEFFALGSTLNLGLDLAGGAHLLFEIDRSELQKEKLIALEDEVRNILNKNNLGYFSLQTISAKTSAGNQAEDANGIGQVNFVARLEDINEIKSVLRRNFNSAGLNDVVITANGANFQVSYSDAGYARMLKQLQEQSATIIRRRVDALGNRETLVTPSGPDRLTVQVPGLDDPEQLKRTIGRTAKLTFHLPAKPGSSSITLTDNNGFAFPIATKVELSGAELVDAQSSFQNGQPVVTFRFSPAGGRQFAEITSQNVGNPLVIVLDGKVISAPNIREPITGGNGVITGQFTLAETQELALLLRAGALPAPLKILEERTVGAGLGADSITAGKWASAIGLMAVMLTMLLIYRLPGLFANIALLFNLILLIALMTAFHSTLTLPGIAGIVLTMGMAVDANILIYERAKEEMLSGQSVLAAWEAGFSRAFATIWDSNLTTLLSTLLLFVFGTGPIKGFALSLSLGIITTLFTAIMLTRLMVVIWLKQAQPKTIGF